MNPTTTTTTTYTTDQPSCKEQFNNIIILQHNIYSL